MGASNAGRDDPMLVLRALSKAYGPTEALRDVDLTVPSGAVHALVGRNGAGKSTLVRILAGLTPADAGSFHVRRRDGGPGGTIGFVQQDLGLVPDLTVRENLQLGEPAPRRLGFLIDHRRERRRAADQLAAVGLAVDPERTLGSLGLGEQALVAVARVFARERDVIVLDEATAALGRRDSERILEQVSAFARRGGAAVVVTHRLHEAVGWCSETTVLRDGRVVHTGSVPGVGDLHHLLADERPRAVERGSGASAAEAVLTLERACGAGVGPIDLEIRAGEVVGLVGALSSNLYAVGHLAAGRLALTGGERRLAGGRRTPVGFVPEERRAQGLFPALDVAANISIGSLRRATRGTLLSRRHELALVEEPIDRLGVTPPDPRVEVGRLSGGNQQKALLGRALLQAPRLYVLCEPTRGVDVGTRDVVHGFIAEVCDAGAAVLVVSVDVDDVLAVADRVGLVRDGSVEELHARDAVDVWSLYEEAS